MGSALEMDNFNGLSHKRRMIRKCSLLVGDVDGKWDYGNEVWFVGGMGALGCGCVRWWYG